MHAWVKWTTQCSLCLATSCCTVQLCESAYCSAGCSTGTKLFFHVKSDYISRASFFHDNAPSLPCMFILSIQLKTSALWRQRFLFSIGSPVLILCLFSHLHSSGIPVAKLLACQLHRSFREKSRFHLDTFWMALNVVLSQGSTEPAFITKWVQSQRDQGLG